jgi:hypothetical protein
VTPGEQLLAELGIIEQLAIEGDPDRPVLVGDRLSTPGEVDDREATGAEDHAGLGVKLLVVRPPVGDGAGHSQEPGHGELATVDPIQYPGDSTHDSIKLPGHRVGG